MKATTSNFVLVSIIINNYNYGQFVRKAIESALNQDYINCEVIIVDDGSTDSSRQTIEEYRDRARIVLKANGGQASAFNEGLSHARGEIVLFLDSDDYLLPNAISRVVANWKPEISRCHFRLWYVDGEGNQTGEEPPKHVPLSKGDLFARELSREGIASVPTSGNAYNRAILDKVFPVDERFRICADGWIRIRTAAHGPVLAIEETLGAYRVHGSNAFMANYVGPSKSDSQMRKVLQSKLAQVHLKIEACLSLGEGGKSLFSIARSRLCLSDIRALLLSKHLGIAGPATELDHRFTFLMLHTLLLCECLRNQSPLTTRLQYFAEAMIISVMPHSWKKRWLRNGFLIKRRLQGFLGLSRAVNF